MRCALLRVTPWEAAHRGQDGWEFGLTALDPRRMRDSSCGGDVSACGGCTAARQALEQYRLGGISFCVDQSDDRSAASVEVLPRVLAQSGATIRHRLAID